MVGTSSVSNQSMSQVEIILNENDENPNNLGSSEMANSNSDLDNSTEIVKT